MAVIVSSNGSIYGLFSTLADANAYVAAQTTPSAYNVQTWLITPAGQSTPLNGSNNT